MGCDIHAYAEVRRKGQWIMAKATMPCERDYSAFGFLAGVRARPPEGRTTLSDGRDIPQDSPTSALENSLANVNAEFGDRVWLGDHSFGWVTLKELLDADPPEGLLRDWIVVLRPLVSWGSAISEEDVRVVFGFDN